MKVKIVTGKFPGTILWIEIPKLFIGKKDGDRFYGYNILGLPVFVFKPFKITRG